MTGFGERLAAALGQHGPLCVGIDAHPYLLRDWGLDDSAAGLREFGLRVVDAAAGRVGVVKAQVAFFERLGSAGYAALEEVLSAARAAGLLTIADAKRGDVGSSVEAYGQAWLTPGSPLEADAITAAAFQGFGSLDSVLSLAEQACKGVFVLAATSNPESAAVQNALTASAGTVSASIVSEVVEWNASHSGGAAHGSVGVVLGATVDFAGLGIPLHRLAATPTTPVLAPGFGHQGARYAELPSRYGPAAAATVVSASRSILSAGPDRIAEAIAHETGEVRECLA